MKPIGILRTPFPDRFGIPRQAGLLPSASAILELSPELDPQVLRGLETFSHIWVIFLFHTVDHPKVLIRPPRLGGSRKVGVLASRSPHRPNPIGLSAVRLLRIDGLRLELGGCDFLDGTPVLDIKPYLPYADAIPDAQAGWAGGEIPRLNVQFTEEAGRQADALGLRSLIEEVFSLDPRPSRRWPDVAVRLGEQDVHASVAEGNCLIHTIRRWPDGL